MSPPNYNNDHQPPQRAQSPADLSHTRRAFIEQVGAVGLLSTLPIGCEKSASSMGKNLGGTSEMENSASDMAPNTASSQGGQAQGGEAQGGQTQGGQTQGGEAQGGEAQGGQGGSSEGGGAPPTAGEDDGGITAGASPEEIRCELTAPQIEGPYYFDPEHIREVIHEGRAGVPLQMEIVVRGEIDCLPIEGAFVEVWHADATGLYSGFSGQAEDTRGQTFLRGGLASDLEGRVQFQTIYPGWYPGRAVHVHFKVTASGFKSITSQLYFPDETSVVIYQHPAYRDRGAQDTVNERDTFLARSGDRAQGLIVSMDELDEGYRSTLEVTLERA
jgi:protocatechuate 3,4-dioxygenase beta subunit